MQLVMGCLGGPEILLFFFMVFGMPALLIVAVVLMLTNGVKSAKDHRVYHRRTNHLCLRCAYDLRATPSRCPECGLIVKEDVQFPADWLAGDPDNLSPPTVPSH